MIFPVIIISGSDVSLDKFKYMQRCVETGCNLQEAPAPTNFGPKKIHREPICSKKTKANPKI